MMSSFTMAYQPIVDVADNQRPYAYEALVRGPNGEPASTVLGSVPTDDVLAFDAACRKKALELAQFLGLRTRLSLNVTAEAVGNYRHGFHATLHAARAAGFPASRLIFEISEHAPIADLPKLCRWMAAARNRGITVALDDFGAGHANIGTLLQLRPHLVKLDMGLVRGVGEDKSRQALIKGIASACCSFGSLVVAEGVETEHELRTLLGLGIRLMQGYHIARPTIEALPEASPRLSLGNRAADSKADARSWRGGDRRSLHV
jgi:EAL domain-containing protein (putative c-di-GMP-specific phosphodiesterase class I)